MHATVNPDMILLGRELRGLSQSQLAKASSISQAVLSRYETGARDCTQQDIERLSSTLNLPVQFFYRTGRIYGPESSSLFHRKRQSVPAGTLRTIYAHLNKVRLDVERLLQAVDMEAPFKFPEYDLDEADVTVIAANVRAAWMMPPGPVRSMIATIENAGGIVVPTHFGTNKIDAVIQWVPPTPPIFLINDLVPGDRLRFTLAHEVGHLVMHSKPTVEIEGQADSFAAAFLMPANDIGRDLENPTLSRLAQLKSYWKVSIQALTRRAVDLGKINERQYRYLLQQLSAAGYKREEPNPIPAEQPTLFKELLGAHVEGIGYSRAELAQMLGLYQDELEQEYMQMRPKLRIIPHRSPRNSNP